MSSDPPPNAAPEPGATTSGQRSVAVGGDVRDSTVITGDSNVIYIGRQPIARNLPWRRLLAGLAVLLAGGAAAYVSSPRPIPTMTGELNVAVAEFGALDARGAAVASPEAKNLASLV